MIGTVFLEGAENPIALFGHHRQGANFSRMESGQLGVESAQEPRREAGGEPTAPGSRRRGANPSAPVIVASRSLDDHQGVPVIFTGTLQRLENCLGGVQPVIAADWLPQIRQAADAADFEGPSGRAGRAPRPGPCLTCPGPTSRPARRTWATAIVRSGRPRRGGSRYPARPRFLPA